jgi:hypothetical protein
MTLKLANIDAGEVTRNIATIVALRVARDSEQCFVSAWPQTNGMSTRWQGESGMECGCGCGPVR